MKGEAARAKAGSICDRFASPDAQAQWREKLRDGREVLIRPIGKDDAALERAFIERLSPESRYHRFLGRYRISDEMIRRFTDVDFRRDMAFVALREEGGKQTEIGVCRFCTSDEGESCECAVTVSDEYQGKGLGTLLMRHLIEVARERGIKRMVAIELAENIAMHALAESLGFKRDAEHRVGGEIMHVLHL